MRKATFSLALASLCSIAHAQSERFDLACSIHTVRDAGTAIDHLIEPPLQITLKVDLAEGRFCREFTPRTISKVTCDSTEKLHRADAYTIEIIQGDEMITINRESGRYIAKTAAKYRVPRGDIFTTYTGICVPRKFSGFPIKQF